MSKVDVEERMVALLAAPTKRARWPPRT